MDNLLSSNITASKVLIFTSITIFVGSIIYNIFKSDNKPQNPRSKSLDRSAHKKKRKEYDSFVKLKRNFLTDIDQDNEEETDITLKNSKVRKSKFKKAVFFSDYEDRDKSSKGNGKLEAEVQRVDDLYFAVFKKLGS